MNQRMQVAPSGRVSYFTQFDMVRQLIVETNEYMGILSKPVPKEIVERIQAEFVEALTLTQKSLEGMTEESIQQDNLRMTELACAMVGTAFAAMAACAAFGIPYDNMFQSIMLHTAAENNKQPINFPPPQAVMEQARAASKQAAAALEEQQKQAGVQ